MFDMRKSTDCRQVLSALGAILILSSIPAVLVVSTQVAGNLLPSMILRIGFYFLFFRKRNTDNHEEKA